MEEFCLVVQKFSRKLTKAVSSWFCRKGENVFWMEIVVAICTEIAAKWKFCFKNFAKICETFWVKNRKIQPNPARVATVNGRVLTVDAEIVELRSELTGKDVEIRIGKSDTNRYLAPMDSRKEVTKVPKNIKHHKPATPLLEGRWKTETSILLHPRKDAKLPELSKKGKRRSGEFLRLLSSSALTWLLNWL